MDFSPVVNIATHFPTDWIIIGAFTLLITLETIRAGANRACSLALALPLGILFYNILPHAAFIADIFSHVATPLVQAGIFLALVVMTYTFAHRVIGFYGDSSGRIIQSILVGVSTAVILIVFWLQIPSLTALWPFGAQIQTIFGEAYRFWWLLGSYVLLAVVRS
jgi:hypothetical protein